MLTLVESIKMPVLDYCPDLGIASLIGTCQEKNIKVRLVPGQTRFFLDFLENGHEDIITIFNSLSEKEKNFKAVGWLENKFKKKGEQGFKDYLKNFANIIRKGDLGDYFNGEKMTDLSRIYVSYVLAQLYYLNKSNKNSRLIENTVKEIKKSKPDAIGFSFFCESEPIIRRLIENVRDLNVPIIVGGPGFSKLSEKELVEWFKESKIDYLVRGQGELALPQIIENLDQERKTIHNTIYLQGNKVVSTPQKTITDFETLPFPDFSQFNLDHYISPVRIFPLVASLGCYWQKCAFCSHYSIYGHQYLPLKPEKVIELITHYREKYRARYFNFHDESISPKLMRSLCQEIINRGLDDVFFSCYGRFDREYKDTELPDMMYKAGFRQVEWGLESGSQRMLDLMNKGTSIKDVSQILRQVHERGISNTCFVMMGFPGEKSRDIKETKKFLKRHNQVISDIACGTFFPEKKSKVAMFPEKFGVKIEKEKNSDDIKYHEINPDPEAKKSRRLFFNEIVGGFSQLPPQNFKSLPPNTLRRNLRFIFSAAQLNPRQAMDRINALDFKNITIGILAKEKNGMLEILDYKNYALLIAQKKSLNVNYLERLTYIESKTKDSLDEIHQNLMQKTGLNQKQTGKIMAEFYSKLAERNAIIFFDKKKIS